jgi:hypothetical protein
MLGEYTSHKQFFVACVPLLPSMCLCSGKTSENPLQNTRCGGKSSPPFKEDSSSHLSISKDLFQLFRNSSCTPEQGTGGVLDISPCSSAVQSCLILMFGHLKHQSELGSKFGLIVVFSGYQDSDLLLLVFCICPSKVQRFFLR